MGPDRSYETIIPHLNDLTAATKSHNLTGLLEDRNVQGCTVCSRLGVRFSPGFICWAVDARDDCMQRNDVSEKLTFLDCPWCRWRILAARRTSRMWFPPAFGSSRSL